ncbi:MAG: DUF4157 domain-containing protein [Deltaproteobacteria bacterium]|nr:DUF4157 domain-containing protein [Deltaproteobacteria bacterium]
MSFDAEPATTSDSDTDSNSGPFSAPVNSLLSASFDSSLDGISVQRGAGEANRALNARAYTMGSTIALGDDIREDVNDPSSMEVIAHEVAHALAGGGSGEKLIDSGRGDAGETAAHAASGAFRDFIARGARGPAPRLSPAHGGTAKIHRFEAGEHADAVDGAAARAGLAPDSRLAQRMGQQITLANGQRVSQGEITAMMGDFYGAYTRGQDGQQHFDPAASFNAMQNADPEEMQRILAHVRTEQANVRGAIASGGTAEPTAPADLEAATVARHQRTDANGTTTGYSFLELAQLNTNHFSTANETGTDNNMGAYGAFHSMAAQAAQEAHDLPPGPARDAAEQRALALEASSQHFMTDRFASGHQFDKQQLMDANGNGTEANIRASVVHNEMNAGGIGGGTDGITLHNGADSWQSYGDGQFANPNNAGNRTRIGQAVSASYGDIDSILSGDSTAADMRDPLATAHRVTPQYDPTINAAAQQRAHDASWGDIAEAESSQIPLAGPYIERGLRNNILHPVEDWASEKWNQATNLAGRAWDATTGAANTAWDATTGAAHTIADGASRAWNATTDAGGRALDWGARTATDAAHTVEDGASRAWTATTDAGGRALDWGARTATNAAHTVEDGASRAWNATTRAASSAADTVTTGAANAWNATTTAVSNGASRAWDATTGAATSAANTVASGANTAWNATTSAASTAAGAVSNGASWVGNRAADGWHAFTGMFD